MRLDYIGRFFTLYAKVLHAFYTYNYADEADSLTLIATLLFKTGNNHVFLYAIFTSTTLEFDVLMYACMPHAF